MTQPIHRFAPPPDAQILQLVPPFEAKAVRQDNEQLYIVEDARHSHVAGMFAEFGHAQCWAMALTKVYQSGYAAGQKSRAARNPIPKAQEHAPQLVLVQE